MNRLRRESPLANPRVFYHEPFRLPPVTQGFQRAHRVKQASLGLVTLLLFLLSVFTFANASVQVDGIYSFDPVAEKFEIDNENVSAYAVDGDQRFCFLTKDKAIVLVNLSDKSIKRIEIPRSYKYDPINSGVLISGDFALLFSVCRDDKTVLVDLVKGEFQSIKCDVNPKWHVFHDGVLFSPITGKVYYSQFSAGTNNPLAKAYYSIKFACANKPLAFENLYSKVGVGSDDGFYFQFISKHNPKLKTKHDYNEYQIYGPVFACPGGEFVIQAIKTVASDNEDDAVNGIIRLYKTFIFNEKLEVLYSFKDKDYVAEFNR